MVQSDGLHVIAMGGRGAAPVAGYVLIYCGPSTCKADNFKISDSSFATCWRFWLPISELMDTTIAVPLYFEAMRFMFCTTVVFVVSVKGR